MTKREFLEKVVALEVEEVSEFARLEIEKLNNRNESRKSKTQIENEPLINDLRNLMLTFDEPMCIGEIKDYLNGEVWTTSKISVLLKKIGEVEVSTKKYNKRNVNAYLLVRTK